MIFITGDTHAEYSRLNKKNFPIQEEMTKNDYVIIAGDFGYWDDSKQQAWWLKWLDEKPFTTLFVDGNHENFDLLNKLPVEKWNGGKIHYISKSVIHLMRGQVFELEGKKIFTFGGARSHDIDDGIIQMDTEGKWRKKTKELSKAGKVMYRIEHLSWWQEEMPNEAEMSEGNKNLAENDWKVDFIITHCGPSSVAALLSNGKYKPDNITKYFDEIMERTNYGRWYLGHYHTNMAVNYKDIVLYEDIIRIN